MKKGILKLALVLFTAVIANTTNAQISDTVANLCAKHLESKFISDGQTYRALLMNAEENAEFHSTLYGGTIYRIAACTGLTDGNLIFTVKDAEGNMIFTNSEFKNAPYWDFKVTNTLDCVIEAKLDSKNPSSGRAVILIGFKQ